MRLRPLLAAVCAVHLFGCSTSSPSPLVKVDEAPRVSMSARLAQYRGQDMEVQAAMKADAQSGQPNRLLKDILADADLRARSAIISRYLAETEGRNEPVWPGAWLLSRVAELLRATEETDKRAAILQPLLTASPMSEAIMKQMVDLTGHRG